MPEAAPLVGIVMGSDSDLDVMARAARVLEQFDIPFEVSVMSAHRSPQLAATYATEAAERGVKVLICGAGRAAHLAGVMAAHTTLPVLGVPVDGGPLAGVDALYATVQMPPGIPVATMAVGKGGAKNAAIFAAQILGLKDKKIASALKAFKKKMVAGVLKKAKKVEKK